ncbi:MAG TPA: TonB-dependent receptor, partial [Chryseosolibacter sp.]
LTFSKTGGFIQGSKAFREKLKLSATLRADKNEYFKLRLNPRVTAVYSIARNSHFRFSFQRGFRFPGIFEAFSNVNSGGVKRVGGLRVMSTGIFENAYKRKSIDEFQAAVVADVNQSGLTADEAIIKNRGLLVKSDYSYVQPERIRSFEMGYRGAFLNEDLQVDLDFYFNRYNDFIAQVEMNIPKTSVPDSIPFYMNDRRKQDRYRLWTNSKTTAYNFGAGIGIRYNVIGNYKVAGNATYAKLQRTSQNDGLEDGFNTPEWIINLSFGNDDVLNRFGFTFTYRWQSSYYWESFLVNGNVPAYYTLDAQVSKTIKSLSMKIGASNILNQYYQSFLGGPSIGGFYYTSVAYTLR